MQTVHRNTQLYQLRNSLYQISLYDELIDQLSANFYDEIHWATKDECCGRKGNVKLICGVAFGLESCQGSIFLEYPKNLN